MNQHISTLMAIIDFLFGHKYYANVVLVRGVARYELTSFIHYSKREAKEHRRRIENDVLSFQWVETISFRSRKEYYINKKEIDR